MWVEESKDAFYRIYYPGKEKDAILIGILNFKTFNNLYSAHVLYFDESGYEVIVDKDLDSLKFRGLLLAKQFGWDIPDLLI